MKRIDFTFSITKYLRVFLITFVSLANIVFLQAASVTFNGTTNSDWSTASNWSSGSVPATADVITIAASKTVVISNTTTVNIASLTLNSGSSITNNGILNITASGTTNRALNFNGSTFDNEGTLNIDASIDASTAGTMNPIQFNSTGNLFTFNGTSTLKAASTKTLFAVVGSATIAGSGFTVASSSAMADYGVFTITSPGATLTINSGTTINIYEGAYNVFYMSNSVSVTNYGTINTYTSTTGTTPHAINIYNGTAATVATFTNYGTLLMSGFEQPANFGGTAGSCKFENKSTGIVTSTYPGISSGTATGTYGILSQNSLPNVFINSGSMTLNATGNAIKINASSDTFTNTGTITVTKGNLTSSWASGSFPAINNNSGGVINFNYGVSAGTTSATNSVAINNNSGASINGSCTFAAGTLITAAGSTLSPGDYSGGVSGIGKMIITPLSSAFALSGNVNIQVNGKTTAGTDYDQISFASTCALTLSGANTLTVTAGYSPAVNDRISIISTTTKFGAFTTTIVPAGWHIDYATPTDIAAKYAAVTWTGNASDGLWSSSANWSSLAVPVSTSDVSIGAYTVTISGSAAINSLSLTGTNLINSGTLTIVPASSKDGINLNTSTFDNEGTLSINSNYRCIELTGTNALTFNGPTTFGGSNAFVTNNSSITTISGAGFTLGSAGTPTSYGLISSTSTGSLFTINTGTTINVYSNSGNVIYMGNSAGLTNNGILNIYTSTTGTGIHAINIWQTTAGVTATFTNGSTGVLLLSGYEQPTAFGGGNTGSTGYAKFDNLGIATINTSSAAGSIGLFSQSNLPNIFTNSGTLNISATYRAIVLNAKSYGGSFSNTGTINITKGYIYGGGVSASDYNTIDNNLGGKINFNFGVPAGTTSATSAVVINNNNGATINGSCTFAVNTLVTNLGSTLSPGDYSGGVSGIGKMVITPASGAFTISGNLNLQVNGKTTAGTDYDQIAFSSACDLTLSGNPIVNLSVGYSPSYNDRISVISSNTLSGSLGSSSLPTGWVTDYALTDVAVKYPAVVPGAPATVTPTAGNTRASIAFTAPLSDGGSTITSYTVTSNPGGLTASGTTSPIVVSGLTNTQAYTFTVTATNSVGTGLGRTSSSVTPDATANIINVATSATTSDGSLTLTPVSDIVVAKDARLTINGSTIVNSITLAAGAQLTNSSSLVASAININSDGINGTGTYVETGTSTIASATVNQNLISGRNWYVSSPVESADTTALSTSSKILCYNEPSASWLAPATTKLTPARGYISVGTKSTGIVSFTGTLNTGNISIGLTRTPGAAKEGFNLVGNPYPCYLDFSKVDTTAANILSTIWYRTKTSQDAYIFDTYNGVANLSTSNGATLVTKLIPPMQAFWVRVKAGQNSGTLTFNNTMRAHIDNVGNRLKAPSENKSIQKVVCLQVSNGINSDETIVLFNSNASNGFDAYDSPKMSNNNVAIPEIFTVVGTEQLVINGMGELIYDAEIPLGFTTGQETNFTIKKTLMANFDSGTRLILKDKLLKTEFELGDGISYNFNSVVTTPTTDRFSLIFRAPDSTTRLKSNLEIQNMQVFVNANNYINIVAPEKSKVSIYNVFGQKQFETKLVNSRTEIADKFHSGVYIVELTVDGQSKTQQVIIR